MPFDHNESYPGEQAESIIARGAFTDTMATNEEVIRFGIDSFVHGVTDRDAPHKFQSQLRALFHDLVSVISRSRCTWRPTQDSSGCYDGYALPRSADGRCLRT